MGAIRIREVSCHRMLMGGISRCRNRNLGELFFQNKGPVVKLCTLIISIWMFASGKNCLFESRMHHRNGNQIL